jgi:hypothetical protein
MSSEKMLETLAKRLQNTVEDEDIVTLQETYYQLKAAFSHVLFDLKNASQDHYAWILISQDASCSLDRLVLAHKIWSTTKNSPTFWLAYKRELADFKWIVTTAMMCKP